MGFYWRKFKFGAQTYKENVSEALWDEKTHVVGPETSKRNTELKI